MERIKSLGLDKSKEGKTNIYIEQMEDVDLIAGKKHAENPWIQEIQNKERRAANKVSYFFLFWIFKFIVTYPFAFLIVFEGGSAALPKPKIVMREGKIYGQEGSTVPIIDKDDGKLSLLNEWLM